MRRRRSLCRFRSRSARSGSGFPTARKGSNHAGSAETHSLSAGFYRNILFRTKTDVIRFLYCHEYYHYYLYEILHKKGSAETACDRFALEHFR